MCQGGSFLSVICVAVRTYLVTRAGRQETLAQFSLVKTDATHWSFDCELNGLRLSQIFSLPAGADTGVIARYSSACIRFSVTSAEAGADENSTPDHGLPLSAYIRTDAKVSESLVKKVLYNDRDIIFTLITLKSLFQ